jgi:hypothetical protein
MPVINPLLQPNVGTAPASPSGDTEATSDVQASTSATATSGLSPQGYVQATGSSGFDGVVSGQAANVLSSAPPVEGGGKTMPHSLADAMARMQFMQSGGNPILQGLVRSTEEGKPPAVGPSNSEAATHAKVGQFATVGSAATATTSSSAPSPQGKGYTRDVLAQSINTDLSELSPDLKASAASMVTDAGETSKKCNKTTATGENKINDKLRGMGLNKDQARTIARTLYQKSETDKKLTAHNDAETTIIAASIALYDKLSAGDGKKSEAPKQIVSQLAAAADNQINAAKNITSEAKYNTAINTLRSYDLQESTASASTALTQPVAQQTLKPYNWHTED